jgi:hypothetical protein
MALFTKENGILMKIEEEKKKNVTIALFHLFGS